jgi:hypothetical protein
MPVRETAKDGSSAWTLRRDTYFVFITLPFAGVCDLLSRFSDYPGPIRTVADTPLRFEYWPVIMHSGFEVQVESIALFDRNRTTRSFLRFALPGHDSHMPSSEEIVADPVKSAALLERAEEISTRVVEATRKAMDGLFRHIDQQTESVDGDVEAYMANTTRSAPRQKAETVNLGEDDELNGALECERADADSVKGTILQGMSRENALANFRLSVNRPETIFSTDHWLLPKLEELRILLSDPITAYQAQALDDVLHGRCFMKDMIEWLELPLVPEADLLSNVKAREALKEAQEANRREQEAISWRQRQAELESERKKWEGALFSELVTNSVRMMVRGDGISDFPDSAKEFPTFLAWWFADIKGNPDNLSECVTRSYRGGGEVELVNEQEWAALTAEDRELIKIWISRLDHLRF